MRKISKMYEWSGGTDYRYLCAECPNCIREVIGKRTRYKCRAYGVTEGTETDWNPADIACRHYGKPEPETPVFFRRKEPDAKAERWKQMNIMEWMGQEESRSG